PPRHAHRPRRQPPVASTSRIGATTARGAHGGLLREAWPRWVAAAPPRGQRERQEGEQRKVGGATAMMVVMMVVAGRVVAPEVLERQEAELGRVRRADAREERAVEGVVELDQDVVAAARIAGFELGDHDE